jgi:hypothetical protein
MVRHDSRHISHFVIGVAVSGAIAVAVVAARLRLQAFDGDASGSPVSKATGGRDGAFDAPAEVFVESPGADSKEGRPPDSRKLAGNSRA